MAKTKKKNSKQKFKYKNANKQKGIILRSLAAGPSLFRIYDSRGNFKDYEITHHDLKVKILDDSAEFLESADKRNLFLDYSRKVLGQNKKYIHTKRLRKKGCSKWTWQKCSVDQTTPNEFDVDKCTTDKPGNPVAGCPKIQLKPPAASSGLVQ